MYVCERTVRKLVLMVVFVRILSCLWIFAISKLFRPNDRKNVLAM